MYIYCKKLYTDLPMSNSIIKHCVAFWITYRYVVGSESFRPDIQKPRKMENAVRDI